MAILKNWINHFNKKNIKEIESDSHIENDQKLVIVSDYAAALGAKFNEPTGDEVLDRCHWINQDAIEQKYHETNKEQIPNFFENPVGMRPTLNNVFANKLSVQGGYLTYNKEYVYFPQKHVNKELSDILTKMALGKIKVPESEFGVLNYRVKQYGNEIRKGIKTASYYYQGQPYCVRVDRTNLKDQLQWYYIRPVLAELIKNDPMQDINSVENDFLIQCQDVLIADHYYRPDKFL